MIKQQPSIWRFHSSGHSLTFYRAESLEEVESKAVAGNLLPSSDEEGQGEREGKKASTSEGATEKELLHRELKGSEGI